MTSAHWRIALPALAMAGAALTPAYAQRPLSAEQRMAILEQQVAASQASAIRLEQRLNGIERQLQQLINQGEVTGHRAAELESAISKLRTDVGARLSAVESRPAPQPIADTAPEPTAATASKSAELPPIPPRSASGDAKKALQAAVTDPGEDAYSEGFHLWEDGQYDRAITALRAFIAGYPEHRRVSFARNLIGRALLDKGQPRPAAEALLANYRADPKGERAADSLYYLGQALVRLNQPSQACKAYAELEDVYGPSVRPDLKSMVAKGKADASCS